MNKEWLYDFDEYQFLLKAETSAEQAEQQAENILEKIRENFHMENLLIMLKPQLEDSGLHIILSESKDHNPVITVINIKEDKEDEKYINFVGSKRIKEPDIFMNSEYAITIVPNQGKVKYDSNSWSCLNYVKEYFLLKDNELTTDIEQIRNKDEKFSEKSADIFGRHFEDLFQAENGQYFNSTLPDECEEPYI